MTEAKTESKEKQGQDQQQLTYDPNNPNDPFRKRAQLSLGNGEDKKK